MICIRLILIKHLLELFTEQLITFINLSQDPPPPPFKKKNISKIHHTTPTPTLKKKLRLIENY